jgi:probable phosphoglycerate mutase
MEQAMKGAGRRRIFLMRHGHVDYFARGLSDPRMVPLTADGRGQAKAAAAALAGVDFDIAVHSGLPRTRDTLEIIVSKRGIQPLAEPGLEELKSGSVVAQSREELAALLAFSFDDAHLPGASFLPEGETFEAAQRRIVAAMTGLITREWRSALIVAHEGVNRIILGWACGGGLRTIGAFEQDLACVNVIDLDIVATGDGAGLEIERALLKAINVTPYDFVKSGLPRTSIEHLFDIDFGRGRPARPA